MSEFHQSVRGQQCYDATMLRIATALERIADRMATAEQKPMAMSGGYACKYEGTMQNDIPKTADEPPPDGDEWDRAAIRNVRRGLERGAKLVRALVDVQIVPGVSVIEQGEILAYAATLLERHAVTYGSRK